MAFLSISRTEISPNVRNSSSEGALLDTRADSRVRPNDTLEYTAFASRGMLCLYHDRG